MSYDELVRLIRSCDIPEPTVIQRESRLREDLHMSSFEMMVLIVKLEKHLQRDINPIDMDASTTVGDLLTTVNNTRAS